MPFSKKTQLVALAIVHIFETSKPFGTFDAYVILDDGAGVSYGVNQFTHRSGSLLAVLNYYLENGGTVGASYFNQILPALENTSPASIKKLSKDLTFKKFLLQAAKTSEMRNAQIHIAQSKYFQKAINACLGSNFVLPISLGVVYDSINHGSWELIRDRVNVKRSSFSSDLDFEKAWITQYVNKRDAWLESVPRLKKTDYRTDFFLAQLARGNWQLALPMNVHGYRLSEKDFQISNDLEAAEDSTGENPSVIQPDQTPSSSIPETAHQLESSEVQQPQAEELAETAANGEQSANTDTQTTKETILQKVQKVGDQIQTITQKTTDIQNSFSPISNASWFMTGLKLILGFLAAAVGFAKDNWEFILFGFGCLVLAAFIYNSAKNRAVLKKTA